MRIDDVKTYYRNNSVELGWGADVARLDPERVALLGRHVIGPKVLDVGCGSGIYTDYLAAKGYDAWGLDLVEEFVEKAQQQKKGTYILSQSDKLPFADGEFDTVLLFDILEHVDDTALMREAGRVASQRILINVPTKVDRALEERGIVYGHYVDKSHIREYTSESVLNLGRDCGLNLLFQEGVNPINWLEVFRITFSGNSFVKKLIKTLVKASMKSRYSPAGIFAVFEHRTRG